MSITKSHPSTCYNSERFEVEWEAITGKVIISPDVVDEDDLAEVITLLQAVQQDIKNKQREDY